MNADEVLVRALVVEMPSLGSLLDVHLHDNFGELLPYVFLADVVRWGEVQSTSDSEPLQKVLEFLDRQFRDDSSTRDLIRAGFLENVDKGSDWYPLLGDNLTGAFTRN